LGGGAAAATEGDRPAQSERRPMLGREQT